MNFARLLTAGKSLVGLRDSDHRYRVNKNVRLPKFGSAKNPFASAPTETEEPAMPMMVSNAMVEVLEQKPVVVSAPVERSEATKSKIDFSVPVRALGRWSKKLNPLNPFKRVKSRAKKSVATATQLPLQGELSLDRVKVVRNDLSDADLEMRSGGNPMTAAPKPNTSDALEPVGATWNRLTTRFFGDDQT